MKTYSQKVVFTFISLHIVCTFFANENDRLVVFNTAPYYRENTNAVKNANVHSTKDNI